MHHFCKAICVKCRSVRKILLLHYFMHLKVLKLRDRRFVLRPFSVVLRKSLFCSKRHCLPFLDASCFVLRFCILADGKSVRLLNLPHFQQMHLNYHSGRQYKNLFYNYVNSLYECLFDCLSFPLVIKLSVLSRVFHLSCRVLL